MNELLTCRNMSLLIGKVIEILIKAAPQPQTNSLQSYTALSSENKRGPLFCVRPLPFLSDSGSLSSVLMILGRSYVIAA
jgi:hypothetical protein